MILGIDPGVRGGAALITESGVVVKTLAFKNTPKERELFESLKRLVSLAAYEPYVLIEKVGYMPGDGGMGAFTFGSVFGLLRGVLLGLGCELHYVYPQMWQSSLCCLSRGNKNVTKNRAIELFPTYHNSLSEDNKKKRIAITHDIADALLIAEYGRRRLEATSAL